MSLMNMTVPALQSPNSVADARRVAALTELKTRFNTDIDVTNMTTTVRNQIANGRQSSFTATQTTPPTGSWVTLDSLAVTLTAPGLVRVIFMADCDASGKAFQIGVTFSTPSWFEVSPQALCMMSPNWNGYTGLVCHRVVDTAGTVSVQLKAFGVLSTDLVPVRNRYLFLAPVPG